MIRRGPSRERPRAAGGPGGGPGGGAEGGGGSAPGRASRLREAAANLLPVSRRRTAVLTRQFAVMVGAGLPLAESLSVLHAQQDDPCLRAAVARLAQEVESGSSLAQAMSRQPDIFSPLAVAMTSSGETGGRLDQSLEQLADELEKSAEVAETIRSAFAYPAVVGAVGALVVTVILWRVVPVFTELYEGLDAELPLATRVVISASESVGLWAGAAAGLLAAGVWLLRRIRRSETGGAALDRFVLSVPLFGRLAVRVGVARFCRTLAALTGAGVPVLEALEVARGAVGNRHLARAVATVRSRVEAGASLSLPLQQSGFFPSMVVQMVGVGERTGELDTSLEKVARFYEDEVQRTTKTLLPLLEPLLILTVGGAIGAIVIAMYMPIWTLVGRIS